MRGDFSRKRRKGVCRENSACEGTAMWRSPAGLGKGEQSYCAAAAETKYRSEKWRGKLGADMKRGACLIKLAFILME